ncbi:hypothetical protein [Microbacterium sp. BLY]|uniref:hypothetical protein n=1 Tax=Microbacterium sp. BLY TaxID=2823280 RepID=UPI001B32A8C1|nr:hypothetical protein [Microbacterium sp. BLY]MBP3977855.1 hypothetical protein [Microbacterium sp. BLY]
MTDGVLPPRFEFSFLVGEVVRNDVFVETETRVLWAEMATAGVASGNSATAFGRLLPLVRKAVMDERTPTPFREVAVPVVQAVQEAHRERNSLVHDQWVQSPWSPGEVRALRRPERRQLSELREVADRLLELTWRVRGLAVIAPAWFPREDDDEANDANDGGGADADDLHQWTRVAMGFIDYDGNQVRGTSGPASLPPGYSRE